MAKVYEIRVRERLDNCWADRFDGFFITREEEGTTVLTGSVVDQAALHGRLMKIRDLGLTLLSVNQVGVSQSLRKRPRTDPCRLETDEPQSGVTES
jgi:hypothetical protein